MLELRALASFASLAVVAGFVVAASPPASVLASEIGAPSVPVDAKPDFKLDGGKLVLPGPIVFKTASDAIDEDKSKASLEHVRAYLEAKTYITLMRIEGHADSDGSAAASQTLTEKRAMSVAKWLVANKVDCKRVLPVGFGSSKPIAPNDTAENKAKNRRIDFVNAKLNGKDIGGLPPEGSGKVAGDPCK